MSLNTEGIHGFWREYRNTFDIASKIEGVELDEEVLGDLQPKCTVE